MRKKLVAGNWKMNLDFDEARQLFHQLSKLDYDSKVVDMLIAPPAVYLSQLSFANSSEVILAAQNCHQETSGAFTGEWSAGMLASIRVDHCIIGHSERRSLFGETDDVVAQKVKACLDAGVQPIICCGESLEERESGKHFDRITTQIDAVLKQMDEKAISTSIIAYEPVWAIGTGRTASAEQAQEMHGFIRKLIGLQFDEQRAQQVRILYGGSVKPANAKELFSMPDVDGGLVGGASLQFDSFRDILTAAS
ncbi:MAG: triose-phosphate isomerase [Flavobacteriales bacterium]|nr:triose-phosphate isomerase [Flavobacteriales bacterium]